MKKRSTLRILVASLVGGGALVAAGSVMALQLVVGWQQDGRYWDGHRYHSQADWMRSHPRDPGPRFRGPIGWQQDGRYWDGRRYYSRADWLRSHPHDRGPFRGPGHRP